MTREEEILIEKVIWLIEDSYPDTNEWGHDTLFNSIKEDLIRRADELSRMFEEGKPTNPWHKVSEELPPVDTEVVCKMKGVPHTKHFVCKWDGKYWWHWGWLRQDAQGWFGLNEGWKVVEWKEI